MTGPMETLLVVVVIVAIAIPFLAAVLLAVVVTRLTRRRVAHPIEGTVLVTAMSNPTQGDIVPTLGDFVPAHENFVLEGTATVPGHAPYPVRIRDAAWTNRWPRVGQTIPIVADRRDPSRVSIQWQRLRAQPPQR